MNLIIPAPNFDYLVISFTSLKILLDDKQTCNLLQRLIIRLDIYDWLDTDPDLLQNVSRIFTNLNTLIIVPKNKNLIMDSVVLAILTNWHNDRLKWIFIDGSFSDKPKENFRQWILDNNNQMKDISFTVNSDDRWLTLWK